MELSKRSEATVREDLKDGTSFNKEQLAELHEIAEKASRDFYKQLDKNMDFYIELSLIRQYLIANNKPMLKFHNIVSNIDFEMAEIDEEYRESIIDEINKEVIL